MPKRQKKYTTRDSILKDIDAAQRKHKRLLARAQSELDAEKFYVGSDNVVAMKQHRDAADALLAKADRLKNTRMVKLQRTLAAFDTCPLPIEGLNVEQAVLGG